MKKGFISVKWEIMFLVVILSAAAIGGLSYFAIDSQKKSLTNELETRGKGIASNLAVNVADSILIKSALETAKTIKQTLKNEGVKYSFVTDKKGVIIAHSNAKMRNKKHNPPLEKMVTANNNIIYTDKNGERIIEFNAPVIAKGKLNLGKAYVGISYSVVENTINKAISNIVLITGVVLLFSILGALLMGMALAKPINTLVKGTQRAGSGDLDFKISVKSKNEVGILAKAFNAMTQDLKKAQDVLVHQKTLEKELDIAKDIQLSIIPTKLPDIPGYRIATFYQAAKEVGGDYFDVIEINSTTTGIVMADVSGKGVPGALVMSMASSNVNKLAMIADDPVVILERLNDDLRKRIRKGMFMTMFYGVLDSMNNTLLFASAGHNETFHYTAATGEVSDHTPPGFPLAMGPTELLAKQLKPETLSIAAGDKIVLFTDGVNEAMNTEGKEWGVDPFRDIVRNHGKLDAQDLCNEIVKGVSAYSKGAVQSDDIAIMVIEKI